MSAISMTGFGRGEVHGPPARVVVELRTVNRKAFDCRVALPCDLAVLEARVRTLIHATIQRGYVSGTIAVAAAARDGGVTVDLPRARARIRTLRQAARELGLPDDLTASRLAEWSDVVQVAGPDPEVLWPLVERAVQAALARLDAMRRHEGKTLARDLAARFRALKQIAAAIARRAPQVTAAYRATLAARIAAVHDGLQLDDATLARELALFADRCAIDEELTRLGSHFAQAAHLLAGPEPCGRPLDFLCQEFFREINTIGSKANDAAIARQVVAFKSGLEAVREQVQNLA